MTFTFRKMQSDVWRVFVQKLWDICLISFTEVVFVHLHLRHKKIKLNVHMSHTGWFYHVVLKKLLAFRFSFFPTDQVLQTRDIKNKHKYYCLQQWLDYSMGDFYIDYKSTGKTGLEVVTDHFMGKSRLQIVHLNSILYSVLYTITCYTCALCTNIY